MKRLAAAAGIVALTAGPALAGSPATAPLPTVRVTTTSTYGTPPDTGFGVKGHWTNWDPGRGATLEVSGTNLPGLTSTALAYWTSHAYPVQQKGLTAEVMQQEDHVGLGDVSERVRLRHRDAGGRWSAWIAAPSVGTAGDGVVSLLRTGQGVDVRYTRGMARAQQIQVEVTDVISDASTNDLFTTVNLLTA